MSFIEYYFWVYFIDGWTVMRFDLNGCLFLMIAYWAFYYPSKPKPTQKWIVFFYLSFLLACIAVEVIVCVYAKKKMMIYETKNNVDCSNNYIACYTDMNKREKGE